MQNSKSYIKNHGYYPKISFKDGEAHTVKLLKDKEDSITIEGSTQEGIRYLVEEGGEHKSFFTSSISLISKLSEYSEGDTVTIQMKRGKNDSGEYRSYFEVFKGKVVEDAVAGAIPVIEENDGTEPKFYQDEEPPF